MHTTERIVYQKNSKTRKRALHKLRAAAHLGGHSISKFVIASSGVCMRVCVGVGVEMMWV